MADFFTSFRGLTRKGAFRESHKQTCQKVKIQNDPKKWNSQKKIILTTYQVQPLPGFYSAKEGVSNYGSCFHGGAGPQMFVFYHVLTSLSHFFLLTFAVCLKTVERYINIFFFVPSAFKIIVFTKFTISTAMNQHRSENNWTHFTTIIPWYKVTNHHHHRINKIHPTTAKISRAPKTCFWQKKTRSTTSQKPWFDLIKL